MSIEVNDFGNGYHLFTIRNDILELQVSEFGATIVSLSFIDEPSFVCGLPSASAYSHCDKYFGATVGRVAGRIRDGHFLIDGKEYQLAKNNNGNALHGGIKGFTYRPFDYHFISDTAICFAYESKDNEEGYPGNAVLEVYYYVEDNKVRIEYHCSCDQTTLMNITNHSYFNLSGPKNTLVLDHMLEIPASYYFPIDASGCPLHNKEFVDSVFDFRQKKKIKNDIEKNHDQLKKAHGYDHYYVFDNQKYIVLEDASTTLLLTTSYPGANIYTANYLENEEGYEKQSAICLEAQYYPDDIHITDGAQTILRGNEKRIDFIQYEFTKKQ